MQQFLIVAAAHFLALLSPGPDFFLVARTAIASGWRTASGACLGIAVANGVFIVMAFAGTTALRPDSPLFMVLQGAGCAYLMYLGVLFLRHAGATTLPIKSDARATAAPSPHTESIHPATDAWWHALGMGFLSGILNPKNALFYASLATLLTGPDASPGWKVFYGLWMFGVVLLWDLLVALLIGNQRVLRRFARALPWLERVTGVMLILLAVAVMGVMLLR